MSNTRRTQIEVTGRGDAFLSLVLVATVAGIPIHFEITSNSGYRAVLPACICERIACPKRDSCKAHGGRTHCHRNGTRFHELHARAFLADVARTYGSARRRESRPPARQTPSTKITDAEWRAARGEITWDEAYA